MTAKKPSPAQNAKKATKPKARPSPKTPSKKAAAPRKAASPPKKPPLQEPQAPKARAWRAASPQPAPQEGAKAEPLEPGKGLIPVDPPRPQEPLTGWELFKSRLPQSWDDFLAEIASGSHMAAFCLREGINYTTLLKFTHAEPTRSEMYARAREDRADILADEIVAISDEVEVKAKMQGEEIVMAVDAAAVQRNRLRVDARKWAASKLKPRIYGEKLELGGAIDHRGVTDAELLARLSKLGVPLAAIMPTGEESASA